MRPKAYIALATALRHCVDGFRSEVYHIPRFFSSEHWDSCTLSPVTGSMIVYVASNELPSDKTYT